MLKYNRLYIPSIDRFMKLGKMKSLSPEVKFYINNDFKSVYDENEIILSFVVEGEIIHFTKRIPMGECKRYRLSKYDISAVRAFHLQNLYYKSKFIKFILNDNIKLIGR